MEKKKTNKKTKTGQKKKNNKTKQTKKTHFNMSIILYYKVFLLFNVTNIWSNFWMAGGEKKVVVLMLAISCLCESLPNSCKLLVENHCIKIIRHHTACWEVKCEGRERREKPHTYMVAFCSDFRVLKEEEKKKV